jgi:hypothetical protein
LIEIQKKIVIFFLAGAFRSSDESEKDAGSSGLPNEQDFTVVRDVEDQKILSAKTAMTVWVGSQRGG